MQLANLFQVLLFFASSLALWSCANDDCTDDHSDCKSTTGFFHSSELSYVLNKIKISIAHSVVEAKCRVMTNDTTKISWLLCDLGVYVLPNLSLL